MQYDVIGDIHGHARELRQLLEKLGYRSESDVYRHPSRRVIFVGDFIDRGPEIREALGIVRPMVDSGSAHAVMGNHEYNALCYHTESDGKPLREHSAKNTHQHQKTLDALSPEQLRDYLAWFRTLPLWLELDGLRIVHACWDGEQVKALPENRLTEELLHKSALRGTPEYRAVDVLLKGKEARLPEGVTFNDKDGHVRKDVRVKWWLDGTGQTYSSMCFPAAENIPEVNLSEEAIHELGPGYPASEPPVLVGHYWLPGTLTPEPQAPNVACVDYSVAKRGKLVAYRWSGESRLDPAHFESVRALRAEYAAD